MLVELKVRIAKAEDILKDIEVERARFEAETGPKVASIMEELDALVKRVHAVRRRLRGQDAQQKDPLGNIFENNDGDIDAGH